MLSPSPAGLPVTDAQDHFALFGLPRRFAVDAGELEARFRRIQSTVHPDRFADAGDAERRRAVQRSAQVNDAYQTLRAPLARARYLLALEGIDPQVESNTAMPAEFLMAQMEWRERFDEARKGRDLSGLEDLLAALRGALADDCARLAASIDGQRDLPRAAQIVREMMFVDRLAEQVNEAIAAIE
jgi:molecular chaperone HscB